MNMSYRIFMYVVYYQIVLSSPLFSSGLLHSFFRSSTLTFRKAVAKIGSLSILYPAFRSPGFLYKKGYRTSILILTYSDYSMNSLSWKSCRSWTRKPRRTMISWIRGLRKFNKTSRVSCWAAISWLPKTGKKCWNWKRRKTKSTQWNTKRYDLRNWGKQFKENYEIPKIRKWRLNSRRKFWKVKLVDWKKVWLLSPGFKIW